MYELEINDIGRIIDSSPLDINLMFVGDTGIGKTTAIENYCKSKGIYLKTLILSQLEASETLGIPVKSTREYNGRMYEVLETAIPSWVFDLAEHKDAILFLDEFLCAQPSVMNAFLNFLTQKNVNGIDLSHVRIVAATNVGNYTFEPDNNILSRFCWFYTINTKINEYLNDKRIINNYCDENERQGVIFETRSLKPRCHEQLLAVSDEFLHVFYEGFTNRKYVLVNLDPDINECIAPYFEADSFNKFKISDDQMVSMVSILLKKFSRVRKWDNIISNFVNLDIETVSRIKNLIEVKSRNV